MLPFWVCKIVLTAVADFQKATIKVKVQIRMSYIFGIYSSRMGCFLGYKSYLYGS